MTMGMHLDPQYITNDDGDKTSVILSIKEFETILEDFEDLVIVAERKDESMSPHNDFLKELKDDGIL